MPSYIPNPQGGALLDEYQKRQAEAWKQRNPNGTPLTRAVGSVTDVVTAPVDLVKALGQQQTWVRVAKVVVGGALVVTGVTVLARPAINAAGGTALTVASRGLVKA